MVEHLFERGEQQQQPGSLLGIDRLAKAGE
jgi:hypothetical protein